MNKIKTTCNRDCPDACGIVAHVEDGHIVRIGGDKEHPITKGALCFRTSRFLDRHYADDRVIYPQVKRDGQFVRVGWEEVLTLVAERLLSAKKDHGPESIFHYQSGGSLGALMTLCGYFFQKLGPCTEKSGDICTGALDHAQTEDFGALEANDLSDLNNAESILIWGKNVYTSSPHTVSFLKAAKKNGARLTLIDPIEHKTARLCERTISVAPGGDFALAMAVARLLFERDQVAKDLDRFADNIAEYKALVFERSLNEWMKLADVSFEEVEHLSEQLAERTTTIMVGWGMGRRKNGSAIVRAVDALAVITGNIGKPGAGAMYYFNRKSAFDKSFKEDFVAPRKISEPRLGVELLNATPKVRVMWVTAGNPIAMLPDAERVKKAIQSVDFVVVVDSWMSDTAKEADVILPCTTLLEDDDIIGAYGHHYLGVSRPVVQPLGEAKSDFEILRALAPRVGLGDLFGEGARAWKARLVNKKLSEHGLSLDDVEKGALRNPCSPRIAFEGQRFMTPSKRASLLTREAIGGVYEVPDDEAFPYFLMALSTPNSQSSQRAILSDDFAYARVNPSCGIEDGRVLFLESRVGKIRVRVIHEEGVRKDVVWMDKGGQLSSADCANALISGALTDLGDGAALYDERVRFVM